MISIQKSRPDIILVPFAMHSSEFVLTAYIVVFAEKYPKHETCESIAASMNASAAANSAPIRKENVSNWFQNQRRLEKKATASSST